MASVRQVELYVETSVWSHWYADDVPDWRDQTRRFLAQSEAQRDSVILLVSDVVLLEIAQAAEPKRRQLRELVDRFAPRVVREDAESEALGDAYIEYGALPRTKRADASHAALATVHEVVALVSWNYRHFVNYERTQKLNGVNLLRGYGMPLRIITPPEVFGDAVQ